MRKKEREETNNNAEGTSKRRFRNTHKRRFRHFETRGASVSWPSRGRVSRVVMGGSRSRRRDVVDFIH